MMKFLPSVLLILLAVSTVSGLQSGREAQNFQLKDSHGNGFSLSDFRGKVVLLEFFASFCGPCKPQLMELKDIRATYPQEQLVMISISFDPSIDTDERLISLSRNASASWTFAKDTAGISDKYEIMIGPTIILIDKAGIIRNVHEGLTKSKVLIPEIDQLLGETPPPQDNPTAMNSLVGIMGVIIVIVILLRFARRRKSKPQKTREQRR